MYRAGESPNPPLWCPTTAVPARKQLKLSVLDGNRSFDLVNAKPARYHCTSQQAMLVYDLLNFIPRRLSTHKYTLKRKHIRPHLAQSQHTTRMVHRIICIYSPDIAEGPTEGGSQRETAGGGASDGPEPVETTSEEMRPHMKMGTQIEEEEDIAEHS
ncbi:hypothetical protein SK128_004873 [Halocaridina rubra]|uniref:Uncharacterized protein n=1 Tax=Halocaridina rubra TaxID=373956 RepID=A0AAN9AEY8_HALRR